MADDMIIFTTEDGEKVKFTVIEEAKLGGVTYLLVVDEDSDENEAYILTEVQSEEGELVFEMLEDETQLSIILDYFNAIMDDIDLEM